MPHFGKEEPEWVVSPEEYAEACREDAFWEEQSAINGQDHDAWSEEKNGDGDD